MIHRVTPWPRGRVWLAGVLAIALAAAFAAWFSVQTPRHEAAATTHSPAATTTVPAAGTPVTLPPLTSAQLAAWNSEVSTAQGRAAILAGFRTVFGDAVTFGVGPMPVGPGAESGKSGSFQDASYHQLQLGMSSNHFWFIVTDYEIRQGVGTVLRAACFRVLPLVGAFICGSIITAVLGASYGTANNHGVWGAVYWWPPHIVIGRW